MTGSSTRLRALLHGAQGWTRRASAAIRTRLFEPVDVAGLVAFRSMFGLLLAVNTVIALSGGIVRRRWVEPAVHFAFVGFSWVRPLPVWAMYAVFGTKLLAALAMAAGVRYRAAALIFFVCHTYVFLLSPEFYLNHNYLIALFALVSAAVPAHRALSFDAWRRPTRAARVVPRWSYVVFCGLISIVFVYGGVAKMNADWLAGEPIRHWLTRRSVSSPLGGLMSSELVVMAVAWGGMLFDTTVPALLVWRRTRPLAFALSVVFHLTNHHLFRIGIFPWFMLAATTLFADPSWPRRLPLVGERLSRAVDRSAERSEARPRSPAAERWILRGLAAFGAVMILVPLRHHLYPGNVAWNEEGHVLSWRMMLHHKTGRVAYVVRDRASGKTWRVHPERWLTARQRRKLAGRPEFVLQFAHVLRDHYAARGRDVEVRANAHASLNYRRRQRLIDPDVDLARVRSSFTHYTWILPFENTPIRPPAPMPAARGAPIDPDEDVVDEVEE